VSFDNIRRSGRLVVLVPTEVLSWISTIAAVMSRCSAIPASMPHVDSTCCSSAALPRLEEGVLGRSRRIRPGLRAKAKGSEYPSNWRPHLRIRSGTQTTSRRLRSWLGFIKVYRLVIPGEGPVIATLGVVRDRPTEETSGLDPGGAAKAKFVLSQKYGVRGT